MLQRWDTLPLKEMIPGFRARFVHSARMTLALWDIDAHAVLPEHHHPHEQITQLLEGEFELTVSSVRHHLKPSDVLVIPPNAIHSGRALTACKILDIFAPVREDYVL